MTAAGSPPSGDTSTKPFLPFALPDIGDEEISAVVETLRSGWVTTGPKAQAFERDFASFLTQRCAVVDASTGGAASGDAPLHAIAVNSATAGLHLALEALGVGPGDEVITTTHTFTATAEVVRYLGADVRLVDIDPVTMNIDVDAVARAINARTRAILPVHFGGLAADMGRLHALAAQHDLAVVEDAAHALPTSFDGRLVGTLQGSAAMVFSFYANKTMTTGEGGMLVTRDPKLAARAKVMRLHGMSRDAFDRFTSKVPSWAYEIVAPGYKYNLTDLAAAMGIEQLKKVERFAAQRSRIAAAYHEAFADLPLILPAMPVGDDLHPWHLYSIRLGDEAVAGESAPGEARAQFIANMFEQGVGCSVHYIPLHQHPYWRERYALQASDFPHSQRAYERLVSLPIYSRMGEADVQRVVGAVRRALDRR